MSLAMNIAMEVGIAFKSTGERPALMLLCVVVVVHSSGES